MLRPAASLLALVIVALLSGACASSSEQLTREALEAQYGGTVVLDGDAFTVTDDTGSMRVSPEAPASLRTPVLNRWIDIATVERTGTSRPALLVELAYGPDRYDDIIIFYEAWAASIQTPVTVTNSDDFLTTTWVSDEADGTVVEVALDPTAVTVKIAEGL